MHYSKATVALFAAGLSSAAPLVTIAAASDADVLNYALTLEHLENTFYSQGLSRFSQQDFASAGYDSAFYTNLKKVAQDESDHVNVLSSALTSAGYTPVAACQYDFGYKDVPTFLTTASVLEGVGVSAYLGAAAELTNKAVLTAAGSILSVEARHSAYLRAFLKQSPFAQPFDTPLAPFEVFSLASGFIKSCPSSNPPIPFKSFPALTLKAAGPVKTGDTVTLLTTAKPPSSGTVYAAFPAVTGPTFVEVTAADGGVAVKIPQGFAGQTYVVLTNGNKAVNDNTVLAGPALIEI